ncbi:MAG TPA: hypothetical protein VNK81_07935 [Thermodesulfobacteriota bacterium]|jgi:hypothetical protein|nr:hypothetical protein [Thermodesulfobacteriota bacterium]
MISIAEYIAKCDLCPIIETFADLGPSFLLLGAPSLWRRYFDTGEVRIEVANDSKRYYRFVLEEIANEDMVSGQAVCTHGVTTWIRSVLTTAGSKTATVIHDDCRYKNSPLCVFEISWD